MFDRNLKSFEIFNFKFEKVDKNWIYLNWNLLTIVIIFATIYPGFINK